jgi:predicted amidophosphoribosyltransferase
MSGILFALICVALGFFLIAALICVLLLLRRTRAGNAAQFGQAPPLPTCPNCGRALVPTLAACSFCGTPLKTMGW